MLQSIYLINTNVLYVIQIQESYSLNIYKLAVFRRYRMLMC